MARPFRFKQFTVHQELAAMKIGTDGVLLGAWTNLNHHPDSILDIGTGTGVIALMMAQRSAAELIDALEIDPDAHLQAVENFENSPWGDRLFCYHASLQEFLEEADRILEDDTEPPLQYDLITCNPPFYPDSHSSSSLQRDWARSRAALPFDHLLEGFSKLLTEQGQAALILPREDEDSFIQLAAQFQLYPNRITRVKGTPGSGEIRSLIQLGFQKVNLTPEVLVIEKERHQYTDQYIHLTKDFYLKM